MIIQRIKRWLCHHSAEEVYNEGAPFYVCEKCGVEMKLLLTDGWETRDLEFVAVKHV